MRQEEEKEWGRPFEDRKTLGDIVEEAVMLGVEPVATLCLLEQGTVFSCADVALMRRGIAAVRLRISTSTPPAGGGEAR